MANWIAIFIMPLDKISILNITVIKNGKKESLSLRPKFLILKEPTHTI